MSSTSSAGSDDDDDRIHDNAPLRSNSRYDELYVMSPDIDYSILDLEIQLTQMQHDVVSVCDSDEHSYNSLGNLSPGLERCFADFVGELNSEEVGSTRRLYL
jgi:hypothetical protein